MVTRPNSTTSHRRKVMEKMKARGLLELVVIAERLGFPREKIEAPVQCSSSREVGYDCP